MAQTKLANLVNPQVMADLIEKKLVDKMRFAPLATIDTTLAGRAGSTISLPAYSYIGDASTIAEGSAVTPVVLNASFVSVGIHKLAQAVEITDEAVLSGFGNPLEEAADQLAMSIASEEDDEMLDVLGNISSAMTFTSASTAITVDDINSALEKFGEDVDDGEKVLVCAPALATALRKTTGWLPASEIAADRLVRGAIGEAYGCQVMISNKLRTSGVAYIVKPNALRLFMKRDTLVETDRDILKYTTVLSASKHFACYLYDESKAVKIAHA